MVCGSMSLRELQQAVAFFLGTAREKWHGGVHGHGGTPKWMETDDFMENPI